MSFREGGVIVDVVWRGGTSNLISSINRVIGNKKRTNTHFFVKLI